ncbi:A/G-specific adenine glycosylase [Bathymodiolus septemdierum thioautotrophic gill symbiont]|uniref:Adenine DNA glycosylase n=1 Tax=endosymbiont of Bathymodiolus septemdierum str. Myojin knoll TaxID=1303921 RepID=A0A0P0UQG2_9GAMM|nr:A/G-specific adenine glycosylase [Bathymodiolus septemdierum thioautotrophic gill symbiont]BAS67053.1 A/G-specific adenine glycosylase [endosymbiont of Bathymodiolus septemdierum str. Myojin knoll]
MHLIAKPLLKWFDQFGRHSLPWQASKNSPINPYFVWLSEIMLQQTQVTTVIGYFNNFIRHFPDLTALANADEDAVLAQWAGLGYYARARNLRKCAKIVVTQYQGEFPKEIKAMIALPGIGESTAGAILSISFGQNHAILDGNVKRVLARYHQVKGHYGQSTTLKDLWHLARQYTPDTRNADYTQAIMDLGATLCTRSKPDCANCPLAAHCQAKKHGTQSEYPNLKPKKIKPMRETAMLIYRNKSGGVYLEKRPEKGIWGGLWSLVECENDAKIIAKMIAEFDTSAHIQQKLPMIKHSFTHFHLMISPIIVACTNTSKSFQSIAELKVGLPAPVKKILAQLG